MSCVDADIVPTEAPTLRRGWSARGLRQRFTTLCVPLLIGGLSVIGIWASARIDATITLHAGHRVSAALEGMMAPFAEELAGGGLSDAGTNALRHDLARTARRLGVVETKVWAPDGRVIFAGSTNGPGRAFVVEELLASAIAGEILMAIDVIDQAVVGDAADPSPAGPGLKIYVPIRSPAGGDVVAVAGFRQDAALLRDAVAVAHRETWAVVGIVGLALVTGLHHVMAEGNPLIASPRADRGQRAAEWATPVVADGALRDLVRPDPAQVAEITEGLLRRIGADIHDGIGQLLAVALMRLDQLFPEKPQDQGHQSVRSILDEAMTEVREMAAGLSLPRIGELPTAVAVRTMVLRHERRTATDVRLTMAPDLAEPDPAVKLAICRFVQEGLGNAFRHAQGRGQCVSVGWAGSMILVTVSDAGPGLPGPGASVSRPVPVPGMGLSGLKTRVEAVGGGFAISGGAGADGPKDYPGTTLRATFPAAQTGVRS